jgi:hypothetical protein
MRLTQPRWCRCYNTLVALPNNMSSYSALAVHVMPPCWFVVCQHADPISCCVTGWLLLGALKDSCCKLVSCACAYMCDAGVARSSTFTTRRQLDGCCPIECWWLTCMSESSWLCAPAPADAWHMQCGTCSVAHAVWHMQCGTCSVAHAVWQEGSLVTNDDHLVVEEAMICAECRTELLLLACSQLQLRVAAPEQ